MRHQSGGDKARALVVAFAQRIGQRDDQHAAKNREIAHDEIALARHAHPRAEQQRVQRRMIRGGAEGNRLRRVLRGELNAETFVVPDALSIEVIDAQGKSQQNNEKQEPAVFGQHAAIIARAALDFACCFRIMRSYTKCCFILCNLSPSRPTNDSGA